MVKAILKGRKTQTRRVLKGCDGVNDELIKEEKVLRFLLETCPYGKVGDRLWVRETWAKSGEKYHYAASVCNPKYDKLDSGWKPSIHMPRVASRISLIITDLRIERLREISCDDAIAEGIAMVDDYSWKDYFSGTDGFDFDAYIDCEYGKKLHGEICSFASLWSKINGLESWLSNPFVYVLEFKQEGGEGC